MAAGRYSLRYWTYENGGSITSANGTVYVNGTTVLQTKMVNRGWWYEICTDAFEVPEGATVSFEIQVKGSGTFHYCVDEVQIVKVPDEDAEPFVSENYVSRLVKKSEGAYYMEVNGKPTVISMAHAHDAVYHDDLDFLVKKIKAVGYNTFGRGIGWGNVMKSVSYDSFDFTEVDNIIQAADENDMYAAINFTGSNCIGTVSTAPKWLKNAHHLHIQDENGDCIKVTFDANVAPACIADPDNATLLGYEKKAVKALMDYIAAHDTNRRIVIMNFYNEASVSIYEGTFLTHEKLANYISELAKAVKLSSHSMITSVNHGFGIAPHFVYNTPYLDMNGSDPYSNNMAVVTTALNTFNSRIPHLWENGGFANSSSQQAAAFIAGGFVSPYPVGPDTYWGRSGLYGENFAETAYTPKLRSLNSGMAKISYAFAAIPNANRAAYNHENTSPTANFSGTKTIGGYSVQMEAKSRNGPIGVAAADGRYIYAIADNSAYFTVTAQNVTATAGHFDSNGSWVIERTVAVQSAGSGSLRVEYVPGEALRFEIG